MQHAINADWRDAILIGAHTGLRMSNITELEWRSVDLESEFLRVEPVKQRQFF
ncbi:MAG: hypothetical protein HC845_11800 [Akkermansiaceae bacterium]|nr:hypothetical protein [Akkermansiaceae bacterium]